MFPLIQLPRKSEALLFDVEPFGGNVSINSTSEEVRSSNRLSGFLMEPSFH